MMFLKSFSQLRKFEQLHLSLIIDLCWKIKKIWDQQN